MQVETDLREQLKSLHRELDKANAKEETSYRELTRKLLQLPLDQSLSLLRSSFLDSDTGDAAQWIAAAERVAIAGDV